MTNREIELITAYILSIEGKGVKAADVAEAIKAIRKFVAEGEK